jgi:hypothetical protein
VDASRPAIEVQPDHEGVRSARELTKLDPRTVTTGGSEKGEESMRWEELSGPAFERAVRECGGVCLLPLVRSSITALTCRRDGHDPCPLDGPRGTRVESAIVFPAFIFTMNTECSIYPSGP